MRRFLERWVLRCRWLLVPLYAGLVLLLLLLDVRFFVEVTHIAATLPTYDSAHLTVAGLTLLDLVLVAGLVIMVMLSGFDTFVARIDLGEDRDGLTRVTRLAPGSVKVRIASAAAIISAIYLLEAIFSVEDFTRGKLVAIIALHLTLVATAVLFAVLDRLERS
jgi:uncharacterized protein (TIGR00645 family)